MKSTWAKRKVATGKEKEEKREEKVNQNFSVLAR